MLNLSDGQKLDLQRRTTVARKAFDLVTKTDALLKGKIQPGPKFVEFDTARRDRLRLQ